MWQAVLDRVLRGFITRGTLRITYPDGTARTYGDATQPEAHITLHDPALMAHLVRKNGFTERCGLECKALANDLFERMRKRIRFYSNSMFPMGRKCI